MSTFSSLLKFRKGKAPDEAQKKARLEFPKHVTQSNLKLRNPSSPVSPIGKHFIIGIATYSADELDLLDQLEILLENKKPDMPAIEVFDVLDCQQMRDFDKFIPGIEGVYGTPVIGVLVNGKLIDQATGLREVTNTLYRFNILNHS